MTGITDEQGRRAHPDPGAICTLVIVPRERFGVALRSLKSVIEHNSGAAPVIYVDSGSPAHIAQELKTLCEAQGYQYQRHDELLSPNRARNLGWRQALTPYVAFLDNDVIVSPGWLEQLVSCSEETGADVVAPLTCQREPVHSEIHQAGGEFAVDHREFFALPPTERRITDVHLLQGKQVSEVELTRGEAQCCEFHCALARVSTLEKIGGLDEALLATKEHIDFCMQVWSSGGTVMFEPRSIVTYLFPNRLSPLERTDWRYFVLRWSPRWQRESLKHFQAKWDLHRDPYFERRKQMLKWRLSEAIAKPLASRIPAIDRSHTLKQAAIQSFTAVLVLWSEWLAWLNRTPDPQPVRATASPSDR